MHLDNMSYTMATIGTVIILIVAFSADRIGVGIIKRLKIPAAEIYRNRQLLSMFLALVSVGTILALWVRMFRNNGNFFGLLAAGLAVSLREPLLSIAGRISISSGRMYAVGDRIELDQMAGDVIGIGFFYTRLLEIGNWMPADQPTGRTILFSNSRVFQHAIFNYTQDFPCIWDEVILPVTFTSDVQEATRILLEAGEKYTLQFAQLAEVQVERMRQSFLVQEVTMKPSVFTKLTSNYVELAMRYMVDSRRRRYVKSSLYSYIYDSVRAHPSVSIGSDTMDLTVHPPRKTGGAASADGR
ncbi:MAG: mechanosensitive ion channel family protein [Acidobacteriaceae bacterium]